MLGDSLRGKERVLVVVDLDWSHVFQFWKRVHDGERLLCDSKNNIMRAVVPEFMSPGLPNGDAALLLTNEGSSVLIDDVKVVLCDALQLGSRGRGMDAATPLLGAIPELDSMAVVHVITALEDHFGITVADDEMEASTFATLGSLSTFVEQKLAR